MKIVFVNASASLQGSVSEQIINRMIPACKGHQYGVLQVSEDMNRHTAMQIMAMADAAVIVSPVYMGSLPNQLLGFFSDVEMHLSEKKARICAVVHGDLFDSDDTLNALGVVERWALKCGLSYHMGLGIGAADQMKYNNRGFDNRHVVNGLSNIMAAALKGQTFPSVCVSVGNRMLYRRDMENFHHKKMEENGIVPDTLNAKIAKLFRS